MFPSDHLAVVEAVTGQPLPYFSLTLWIPGEWGPSVPGQFVMLRVGDLLEPYLRRAFSLHDLASAPGGQRIELLIKVVGRGTAALSRSRPGDELALLGPLGRGFRLDPSQPDPAGRVALVAGGVGSAPLYLLARELARRGVPFDLYYGGRTAADLPCRERFAACLEATRGELIATTEDGSFGRAGLVTEPLETALASGRYRRIYACGPMGLLRRLAELSAGHGVPGEAALETPMGCGFGACLGCAVPTPEGRFALCCQDGPVFAFEEVHW